MIVKKFYGRTVEEVIKDIKENLGEDATLLLVQKVRKKGLRGFLGFKEIEITAAKEVNFEIQEKISPVAEGGIIPELPALCKIKKLLKEEEVDTDIINNVISSYIEATGGNRLKLQDLDTGILESLIKGLIKTENDSFKSGKIRSIFIGPPGAGKTTTILKLAAHYSIEESKSTAIITTDIYRSGAIEQLKVYSKMLDIPVEVAFNVRDFERIIRKFDSKDVILVDSAGRSKRDKEYVETLRKFIYTIPLQGLKVYLVVSIMDSSRYIKEVFENYKILYPNFIIVSKLDEATSFGNLINIPVLTDLPIAYVTTGQDIPGDIEVAKSNKLANFILKGNVDIK